MRLSACFVLVAAAACTMGCAGSRAYNLYSGTSPLDESVYGVDQAVTFASVDTDDNVRPAPVVRATVDSSAPVSSAPVVSTSTYARRTTLQSPPPPPPPPAIRSYRTASARSVSTPVRTASTVRTPTRTLPRAEPVVVSSAPAPVAAPAEPPAPTYTTYRAPSRPAAVRAQVRRFTAPIRKKVCPPSNGLGIPCLTGT
jgi:hypothetical protein